MSTKRKSLSIIIPAYNEERHLRACLDAIAAQTEAPDEVVVVDNNSSDQTAHIADSYVFVKLIREKRQGVTYARNAGFAKATSELIGRIDADTVLDVHWVRTVKDYFMHQTSVAAVTGKCYFYDVPLPRFVSAGHALGYHHLQHLIAGTDILWGSNMAIRRSAWRQVQAHSVLAEDLDEDIMLSLHLHAAGLEVARTSRLVAYVSIRGHTSFRELAVYLKSWPRDYAVNSMPIRKLFILALLPVSLFGGVLTGFLQHMTRRRKYKMTTLPFFSNSDRYS